MRRLGFVAVSFGFLVFLNACQPGPVDPPLDMKWVRQDVETKNIEVKDDSPLAEMNIPAMWARTSGKDRDQNRVKIALIGTGIDYTNPDLRNSLWQNVGELGEQKSNNGFDDDGNGYDDDVIGFDFFSGDGRPYDWHGHDTFTAALIGASGKKNAAVVGVSPNADLMVLRYMGGDGDMNPIDAFFALLYAVDNGAKVAYFNYPKGGFPKIETFWGESIDYGEMIFLALQYAQKANVLVVIPAGNDSNSDVSAFIKDERLQQLDNVLVVAGLGRDGSILPWSNSGVKLASIAAPAEGMLSFFPGSFVSDGMSTTSVAAAYATGAAALISNLPGFGRAKDIRSKLLRSIKATPNRIPVLSGGPLFLSLGQ